MKPGACKFLDYLITGILGSALPLATITGDSTPSSQKEMDLLNQLPDTGKSAFLSNKSAAISITPEVDRKSYERNLAGSLNWDLLIHLIKDRPQAQ